MTTTPDETPIGPLGLRLSSLVRAAGTAATVLAGNPSGLVRTAVLAGGTHLAAREIDPRGIQVLTITPDRDINLGTDVASAGLDDREKLVLTVSSTASWVGANLLFARLARLLPFSRPVKAVLLGVGIYLLDDFAVGQVDRLSGRRPDG